MCAAGSSFWLTHVRFRNRLRTDEPLAYAYVALKRALASEFPDDRVGYTDAKDGFIARALGAPAR